MAKIRVKVTQEDIKTGLRSNAVYCPIAHAMHQIKNFENARVFSSYIFQDGHTNECRLPEKAIAFIEDFDHNHPVKPFSFTLDCDGS